VLRAVVPPPTCRGAKNQGRNWCPLEKSECATVKFCSTLLYQSVLKISVCAIEINSRFFDDCLCLYIFPNILVVKSKTVYIVLLGPTCYTVSDIIIFYDEPSVFYICITDPHIKLQPLALLFSLSVHFSYLHQSSCTDGIRFNIVWYCDSVNT